MSETDAVHNPAEDVDEVGREPVPPLPDDVARAALRGDPEAQAAVDEAWEQASSMEGEAPTG